MLAYVEWNCLAHWKSGKPSRLCQLSLQTLAHWSDRIWLWGWDIWDEPNPRVRFLTWLLVFCISPADVIICTYVVDGKCRLTQFTFFFDCIKRFIFLFMSLPSLKIWQWSQWTSIVYSLFINPSVILFNQANLLPCSLTRLTQQQTQLE